MRIGKAFYRIDARTDYKLIAMDFVSVSVAFHILRRWRWNLNADGNEVVTVHNRPPVIVFSYTKPADLL